MNNLCKMQREQICQRKITKLYDEEVIDTILNKYRSDAKAEFN